MCVYAFTCVAFTTIFFFSHLSIVPCLLLLFLFYYFRAFFFVYLFVSSSSSSSVIWFFYFSLCFFFILFAFLSRNNTLSLSFFSLSILANRFVRDRTPPVLPRNSPFLFSLSVALFRLPPVLPSHENYPETRESKRDREVRRGGI